MADGRRYHHGDLRAAVIAAAVHEVEAVGANAVSMREIARRAGVSHAAPAHHFGDKTGIFTAIAAEGFRMACAAIGPAAEGPGGFLRGGIAYVAFALAHPGHYDVMFRPDLHRADDPDLVAARDAAFAILYGSARRALQELGRTPGEDDVTALVLAGWSTSHGFATLWQTANLASRLPAGPAGGAALMTQGIATLGDLVRAPAGPAQPVGSSSGADAERRRPRPQPKKS
jgi:AcrR family transcriptional regulator